MAYAAFNDFGGPWNGVVKVAPYPREFYRIPGTENMLFPTALTFDNRGNLYVSSTLSGSIWMIDKKGGSC